MTTTAQNVKSVSKAERAQAAFARLLADASRKGFHGTATLTLSVQDGHIQHLKIAKEQMIR